MVDYYDNDEFYEVKEFEVEMGMGISCTINEKKCLVGNEKLFKKHEINIAENIYKNEETATVIYSYYDNNFLGSFSIKDTPKRGIKDVVNTLKSEDYEVTLLTGDNDSVANDIGKQVNIDDIHSNCLPEDKLEFVDTLRRKLRKVMMVGDGINDASALKRANIGVAMGGIGSDITIDSADLVFINDDISFIPYIMKMSKRTFYTIKFGIIFSLALNTIAMILGMIGVLTPITGALVHNVGSVFVIILAALLFRQKPNIKEYIWF